MSKEKIIPIQLSDRMARIFENRHKHRHKYNLCFECDKEIPKGKKFYLPEWDEIFCSQECLDKNK